jgi:hypothetical protein
MSAHEADIHLMAIPQDENQEQDEHDGEQDCRMAQRKLLRHPISHRISFLVWCPLPPDPASAAPETSHPLMGDSFGDLARAGLQVIQNRSEGAGDLVIRLAGALTAVAS